MLGLRLARALQEVAQQSQLLERIARVPCLSGLDDRRVEICRRLTGQQCQLDQHTAPVHLVSRAVGIAGSLQPVESGSNGTGRQAALVRQLSGGHGAPAVERREARKVRAVDRQALRHGFVHGVGSGLQLGQLQRHFVDESAAFVLLARSVGGHRSLSDLILPRRLGGLPAADKILLPNGLTIKQSG